MAYGRDFPREQDDDRQRLTGRWTQDDETGDLRRRFDDDSLGDEAYRGEEQRGRGYADRRDWDNPGGYYGEPQRRFERGGGHAFDFARRDSGRTDMSGRGDYRAFEGRDRFGNREDYDARYAGRSGSEFSNGSPAGRWPAGGARPAGSFRGKGPKGYVRSDERIKEDVSDRLTDDDTLDASDITVDVAAGEVTLSGYVDSRQAKRTAEECAEQCAGVINVQNNLRVRGQASLQAGSTSGGSVGNRS